MTLRELFEDSKNIWVKRNNKIVKKRQSTLDAVKPLKKVEVKTDE